MRLTALSPVVLAVTCTCCTTEVRPVTAVQAIVGATLIDGTGSVPLPNSVMIVGEGRLQCVGTPVECPIPRGASILPADGLWAIPGLIDTHVHLTADGHEYDPRLLLAAGITTARDAAGFGTDTGSYPIGRGQIERVAAIWQRIQNGDVPGPRLRYCGPGFYSKGTGGYDPAPAWATWVRLPAGDTNVSPFVDYLVANGSSCVKLFGGTQIFGAVTLEHLRALSKAGRARGLPVIGHTQDNIPLLEQMPLMDEMHHTWLRPEDVLDAEQLALLPNAPGLARTWAAWAIFDPSRPKAMQLARAVADAGVAWVPTLTIWDPRFADDLGWVWGNLFTAKASATDSSRFTSAVFAGRPPLHTREDTLAVLKQVGARFARAWTSALHKAGVQILAGSDAGPGGPLGEALHSELANLVQAGLSPMEALNASTGTAAKRLHIPGIGTIIAGNSADIVLLEADPLADISNTRKIRLVVANGHAYRPDSLLAALK